MTSSTTKKHVLVLSLAGIGNFLMQSPTFAALRRARPDWRITVWVAPRGTRALAEINPNIDEIIERPIHASAGIHISTIRSLRQRHFDIGIVLSPGQLLKSATFLFLAGIPKRIGNTYPLLISQSGLLLTNTVPEQDDLHDIEQNLRLLTPLGITGSSLRVTGYDFSLPPKYQRQAGDLLIHLNVPAARKLVGFHMGSDPEFLWKRWPLEHFEVLAKKLIDHNAHILLFGGRVEKTMKKKLKDALGSNATAVESDVLTSAAAIQRCHLFLSNDSGLMHIAAALGVRTFGLFGPTDEKKTGPRGRNSVVIRAPGTHPVYDRQNQYVLGTTSHDTMRALIPEFVFDKISRYL